MDANGLRFWLLADSRDWVAATPPLHYDPRRLSLQLPATRLLEALEPGEIAGAEAAARTRLEQTPATLDAYGTRAWWDADAGQVLATGAAQGAIAIFSAPAETDMTDLAMGWDGILYAATSAGINQIDRRGRWEPALLSTVDFTPWRLAADPAGGVWALDPDRGLARLTGRPLRDRPATQSAADRPRPEEENPHPPTLRLLDAQPWGVDETPVAIACSAAGCVALLLWLAGGEAGVRLLREDESWSPVVELRNAGRPYSLAWIGADRLALLIPRFAEEAPVYPVPQDVLTSLPDAGTLAIDPVGDFFPLQGFDAGPYLHVVDETPHYPVRDGSRPLHALSFPTFAKSGTAVNARMLDSGGAGTVWHRLYLEAALPSQGGITIWLAATDAPDDPIEEWYAHRCGERYTGVPGPRAAWLPEGSELPFQPGLRRCPDRPGRAGLFTVLIQRATRRVRALRGRYLHVRVEMEGDGRATPELWALRAYAGRFSYRDQYLADVYGETAFGPDADRVVAADERTTAADFLERFLANFEGMLTPLEDRIAHAYLLTDPRTTHADALDWLGSWIGITFDPAYPPDRRRSLLQNTPELCRRRGTLGGLELALEVATGGGISRGDLLVFENFRLRRTFATILGADLADEEDPLLAGLTSSGNSHVGDTLFLGDDAGKAFLALFELEDALDAEEADALQALFDALAFRATVMVHDEVDEQDLTLIRRVVELETPAHVETGIALASYPFIVGIADLVGFDSYLRAQEPIRPVRIDTSRIGLRDIVQRPPSLDPRLEGAWPSAPIQDRPQADAGSDRTVTFPIDARGSRAGRGSGIDRYRWTWLK